MKVFFLMCKRVTRVVCRLAKVHDFREGGEGDAIFEAWHVCRLQLVAEVDDTLYQGAVSQEGAELGQQVVRRNQVANLKLIQVNDVVNLGIHVRSIQDCMW